MMREESQDCRVYLEVRCENIRFHTTGKIIKGVMGSFLSFHMETRGKLEHNLLKDMLDDIGLTERWVDFSLGMMNFRP